MHEPDWEGIARQAWVDSMIREMEAVYPAGVEAFWTRLDDLAEQGGDDIKAAVNLIDSFVASSAPVSYPEDDNSMLVGIAGAAGVVLRDLFDKESVPPGSVPATAAFLSFIAGFAYQVGYSRARRT